MNKENPGEKQPKEIPVREDPDKRYPMRDPEQKKNPGDDKHKPIKFGCAA